MSETVTAKPPLIGEGRATGKTGLAWAWFEWARNPYYFLVVIYVFAPYFARDIVGADILASGDLADLDPKEAAKVAGERGQAAVASLSKWAGAVAALTAPILGAAFDKGLYRKPFLAVFLFMIGMIGASLWWAIPGEQGFSTFQVMCLLAAGYVFYTYSEVTHNSMLPFASAPDSVQGVSGLGIALGALAASFLLLFLVIGFFTPSLMGWPMEAPLFGLDPERYEPYRFAGPLAAIWLGVMILPFFLFGKDDGIKGTSLTTAFKEGGRGVIATVKQARKYKNAFRFLIARTLYADGMSALLFFGGVYVTTFLGWNIVELTVYAIWASLFAVVGGIVGGELDRRFGPKMALIIELTGVIIILFFGLSITPDSLLYGLIPSSTVWGGPIFQSLSDVVYILQAAVLSVFAAANISSSRSMLIHVAPPHLRGEFFGLFAIAGTVTVWLGPLMVEVFTKLGGQRVGIGTISILFVAGLIILQTVNSTKETPAA